MQAFYAKPSAASLQLSCLKALQKQHNIFMTGRICGIKKSLLLRAFAILAVLSFVAYVFLSIFWLKDATLWFFGFCLFVGSFELVKSFLFRFDSCIYIGTLLVCIGIFGYVFSFNGTAAFAGFYVSLAFMLASVVTYFFTGQKFHLVLMFSILFVSLYCLLYVKNLISAPVLVAFLLSFLLLLILEIMFLCFHKK